MYGLTKRQQEIVTFICDFVKTFRYSPSCREIMHHFGFTSPGTVSRHLAVLKRKGALIAEKGGHRSLVVTPSADKTHTPREIEVPFIGMIGGTSLETFPQSRSLAVPAFMIATPEKTYALKVVGDNWADERIVEGDILLVEARSDARSGETVVARLIQGETVVKRFYSQGQHMRLVSHHPHFQPLMVKQSEVQIQGVVVGLLRLFD